MKKTLTLFLILFSSFTTQADQTLITENVWIREAPPTVKVFAAYMKFTNPTDKDIVLICAESPAFKNVMFHRTEVNDGIAKMRHVDEIIIPAHSSFELTPGNYHMMLMGKKNPVKAGDTVELTLIFKNNENQQITALIKKNTISE